MKEFANYSLLSHNTFGMPVKAERFVEYDSIESLQELCRSSQCLAGTWLHIGGGSNLLFTKDYAGTILHSAIKGYEIMEETDDSVLVRVGAGVVWDDFVAYAVQHHWYGPENLSLIPGEVGASAVQNIGAYGSEVKDFIEEVETVEVSTGSLKMFKNEECGYAYRKSFFKKEWKGKYIVTRVFFRLSKLEHYNVSYGNIQKELESRGWKPSLENIREVVIAVRQAKLPDPAVQGNAGSFFMNPVILRSQYESLIETYPDMPHYVIDESHVKVPAAWLIDRCGWKGKHVGRAGVHTRQALVLVNLGGATGEEVIQLSEKIQQSVNEQFGIAIYPEVNFI